MDEVFDAEDEEIEGDAEELDDNLDDDLDDSLEDDGERWISKASTPLLRTMRTRWQAPAARRKRPSGDDDEEDDEEFDSDDVEADLDAILKDRIAASTDDEDEDEDQPAAGDEDREGVTAKSAEEFTCTTCFMIVHPRQFGCRGNLACPEGYSPCSSIPIVEKKLNAAAKK